VSGKDLVRGATPAPTHATGRALYVREETVDYAGDGSPVDLRQEMGDQLADFELGDHRGETLVDRIVDGLVGAAGATILVVMAALVFLNAAGRYLFSSPLVWSDEIVIGLMPWLAICGVFLSIRQRQLIRIEYFVQMMPPRWQRAVAIFSDVFCAVAFCYLAIGGFQQLNLFGSDTSLFLDIPTGWFTSALAVGTGLIIIAFVVEIVRTALARKALP
jgi:TRAP-type C4-dicarboxylate transport system permease small subunit